MSMTATAAPHQLKSAPTRQRVAGLEQLRVLVIAGDPSFRRQLRDLLDDQPDFTVLASAPSAETGLLAAQRTNPDLAVVDYELNGRGGLWLARELKRLGRPPLVVLCADYPHSLFATAMPAARVDLVVDKADILSDLCEVLRRACTGFPWVPAPPWQI